MGCASSGEVKSGMSKSEKAIKSAVLIQRWYRKTLDRLEARRRTSWAIFQSIEYAGEQDQVKLSKFFTTMLEQFSLPTDRQDDVIKAFQEHRYLPTPDSNSLAQKENQEEENLRLPDPKTFLVNNSYKGPHLRLPITRDMIKTLITAFKDGKILHIRYVLDLLYRARKILMTQSNIRRISTYFSGQVTVCGDLHGNLHDLYEIFQKNGLPGPDNPYIFNGDYVDRGSQSVEVMVLLLSCLLYSPNHFILNRGNHEDPVMNIRYGFTKEVIKKYKKNSSCVLKVFHEVFRWLPLATIVDEDILITHGGLSESTDLDYIEAIRRNKYVSVLRPPAFIKMESDGEPIDIYDLEELRQMLDLLWSDPRDQMGCYPNVFRGGGCYFGPDITSKFLENNNLRLLIRSHECKKEGYEYTHDRKVLTIFSASNYYEVGSNKGAYAKVMADAGEFKGAPECHLVQFISDCRGSKNFTFTEIVSRLETSALSQLQELIVTSRSELEAEFAKHDPENTGMIESRTWCNILESIITLDVVWSMLAPRLVQQAPGSENSSKVLYDTTFQAKRVSILHKQSGGPSVTESLYRHKDILETIFRTFDLDSSGRISMWEFSEACEILIQHSNIGINPGQIVDIARSLDLNKDGYIDFNEFLEAFRIVDSKERRRSAAGIPDLDTVVEEIELNET